MWDLPRPGLEPVSPTLAGRFSTTAPPGKPEGLIFKVASTTKWPHFLFHQRKGQDLGKFDFSLYNFHCFQGLFQGLGDVHVQSGSRHQALIPKYLLCTFVWMSSKSFKRTRLVIFPAPSCPSSLLLSRDHHPPGQSSAFSLNKGSMGEWGPKAATLHLTHLLDPPPASTAPGLLPPPERLQQLRRHLVNTSPFPGSADMSAP